MSSARTAEVLEAWGPRIVGGTLAPGATLLLDDVMTGNGVSRTTARDAVKVLEALRLVRPRRHLGIEVLPPSDWDQLARPVVRWRLAGPERLAALVEISQLRQAMEPFAAGMAADHATPAQRRTIDEAALGIAHCAAAGDDEGYLAHDVVLHSTILEASGNPLFASLTHLVEEGLDARTHHHLMPDAPDDDSIQLHRRVAEAITVGDGPRAHDVMGRIVQQVVDAVGASSQAGTTTTHTDQDHIHQGEAGA